MLFQQLHFNVKFLYSATLINNRGKRAHKGRCEIPEKWMKPNEREDKSLREEVGMSFGAMSFAPDKA